MKNSTDANKIDRLMKLENNWLQKSLENLEKKVSLTLSRNEDSYLIKTCNLLYKKQLQCFTTEDLRIMIGQEIGLDYLIPLAIDTLKKDLFAEGDYYAGDLLKNVLNVNTEFWNSNENYWQQLNELIKNRRQEISKMKFDLTKFDNFKYSK